MEQKTYKQGDTVNVKNSVYEVIEDLGDKLVIRPKGSKMIRMTVKKERLGA